MADAMTEERRRACLSWFDCGIAYTEGERFVEPSNGEMTWLLEELDRRGKEVQGLRRLVEMHEVRQTACSGDLRYAQAIIGKWIAARQASDAEPGAGT